MAGINIRLKGSTLLECIVAGIILLVCFAMTMDTLTRITLSRNDSTVDVAVEIAFRDTFRKCEAGQYPGGKYTISYDWGNIDVEVCDYTPALQHLTLTALPAKRGKARKYEYLVLRNTKALKK